MNVTINGESSEVADGARVADVVSKLAGGRREGIAVAMNGEIVPKSAWSEIAVHENDSLEVLSAIGGG